MRPDRIIVGEVRQEECLDLLIALNSGLPGMCSIHANSAREAIVKLCTLPLLAGENVGHGFVVPTVAACVDVVVHTAKDGVGAPAGARDRRGARAGRGRRRRGRRPVRDARAAAGAGGRLPAARGALRLGRASTWPTCSRTRTVPEVGALLGLLLGLGLLLVVAVRSTATAAGAARRRRLVAAGRADLLAQAGIEGVTPRQLAGASAGLAAGRRSCWCSAPRRCRSSPCCSGCSPGCCRCCWSGAGGRSARSELREVWPEAVDNLASGVRAGLVAAGGAEPARGRAGRSSCARRSAATARTTARPAGSATAWTRSRPTLADPVGDRVVEALRMAREVGGTDLGPAAAHAVGLPARGRPHPRRAGDAAGLDGQRRPAGAGRAVGAAAAAVDAAGRGRGLQHAGGHARAAGRVVGCRSRPTGRCCGSPGCRPSGGCCGERDAGHGAGRRWPAWACSWRSPAHPGRGERRWTTGSRPTCGTPRDPRGCWPAPTP